MSLGSGDVALGATPCGSNGTFDASGPSCTYTHPGSDTFAVPFAVTSVTIDAFGAQGGQGTAAGDTGQQADPGGLGGEAKGTLATTDGQVLEVSVGGRGADGGGPDDGAGVNGGGGGSGGIADGIVLSGGGGGGASDVRTGSCAPAKSCDAGDRVLTAGGGGGTGVGDNSPAGPGGGGSGADGGMATGTNTCPFYCGDGGKGGANGGAGGAAGFGGVDGTDGSTDGTGGFGGGFGGEGAGGGGGGQRGGGGGGSGQEYGGGGGGGSNFAAGPLTDTSFSAGVSHGNGEIVITWTQPPTADLSVSVTGPVSATAGASVTYTATVANGGPADASALSLTDAVPAGATFVSETRTSGPAVTCANPPAGGTGTTTCTASSFASAATTVLQLVYSLPANFSGTSVSDTAAVSAASPDPDLTNNTDKATTSVTTSADAGVSLSGPANATAGATVTYIATVSNTGPSDAAAFAFTDAVPAGATFITETQTSGPALSCTNPAAGGAGTTSCTAATLAAGATATVKLAYLLPASFASSSISDSAAVSETTHDAVSANNTDDVTTPVTTSADAGVSLTGPAGGIAGTTVTYTAVVTNAGPSDAQGFALLDTVPSGTTFVSETQTSGPALSCTNPAAGGTGTTSCTAATLAAGATATVKLVYLLPASFAGNSLSDTAVVSETTHDPVSADDSDTATTPVTTSADVAVSLAGQATATAGGTAAYSVTIANNGPSDAQGVTLTDAVPAGTTFVSETQTAGPVLACTNPAAGSTGITVCTIGTLAAGATAKLSLIYSVNITTVSPITDMATVGATTSDPISGNNTATVTTTVLVPTTLVAYPALVELPPAHTPTHELSATLTTIAGVPLPGQTITFIAGGHIVCTETTDSTGTATCTDHAAVVEATRHHDGYDASFAGMGPYQPSTAHGVDVGHV